MQKNVLAESQEHNDLVVEDFHDVYLNLTMVVRFTLKAASKKKGLKKVVAKVIAVKRSVGKYVVINSLVTFRFKTTIILKVFVPSVCVPCVNL